MEHKKLKLSTILLIGFGLTGLQAQEAIPATGGDVTGSGGTVSYSIGQIVYNTNTGTNGSVAQGVQQPYEISVIVSLEEKGITLQFSAYPNPAADFVKLKVDASTTLSIKSMSYQLCDIKGKLLENKKIESDETNIDMKNLLPAAYFLKVIRDDKEIKIFKIIKN